MSELQTHRLNTTGTAILSPCGTYRYVLTRRISQPLRWIKPALFIMLNPSTADAQQDDATITRCTGFAKSWGCTGLTVVNLFAYRSAYPTDLIKAVARGGDIVGPDNESHIHDQIERHQTGVIIAAFGAHPLAPPRARAIGDMMARTQALKLTKAGWPSHPLYLKADLRPIPWSLPV